MPTLLTGGFAVKIRVIHAADASMLQAFVRRLSVRSRRFRFFSGLVELPAQMLQRFVDQDRDKGLALVALSERLEGPAIVAEARYVVDPAEGHAEFALAVDDEFQRRGLGMRLLKTLVTHAARRGVRRMFGEVLADNHAMLGLAQRLGFKVQVNAMDRKTMIASIVPQGD
ncbi:MAG: GNAT family N-acetyltransferase [Burkholderiales bacterium]